VLEALFKGAGHKPVSAANGVGLTRGVHRKTVASRVQPRHLSRLLYQIRRAAAL